MIEKFERVKEPNQEKDIFEKILFFLFLSIFIIMIIYLIYINLFYNKGELEIKKNLLNEEIQKNLE